MEYSNVCSEKGRGSEIISAVSVLASERRQAVAFKAKRPASLSEKSTDSSPDSGVSSGSKMRSPNGPAVSSKDAHLGLDSAMPSGKRHCSSGAKDALKKANPDNVKRGNLIRVESEITTEGIQGAVVDPGCPDICIADDGMDPADLVSWPDNAVLDFSMDHVDSGEIEDMSGAPLKSAKKLSVAASEQKEGKQVSEKEASQDSQSESAAVAGDRAEDQQGAEGTSASSGKGRPAPPGKRKVKVDWTPELHRRFVQAVEQLGVEKAIPSRILELMGVKCLTRHNIASHLQKYRSHRRHLAAKEAEAANWQQQRKAADAPLWPVTKPGAPFSWNPYPGAAAPGAAAAAGFVPGTPAVAAAGQVPGRPVMGMPPSMGGMVQGLPTMGPPPVAMGQPQPAMGTPHGVQAIGMPMHVWGHPAMDPAQAHMWQRPGNAFQMTPSAWYGPDGSVWQYPTPYAASPAVDMWGQPTGVVTPGGMVAGTPCFPPHMMPHMGSQQFPAGMTSGAPVHGVPSPAPGAPVAGAPMTQMESKKQNYHQQHQQQQHQQNNTTSAPVLDSSALDEATAAMGGCENDLTMDGFGLDSFLDEAVTESMFAVPDELSLSFSCNPDELSELQASNILDAAISEALANPSTPLPIGLKPPSVDGVLEELHRQGITMLPPIKAHSAMAAANTMSCHDDFSPISAVENIADDAMGQADMLAYDDSDEDALSQEALNALLDP